LAYGEGIIHHVKDGENVEAIAAQYSISPETIRWANGMAADSTLKPGQDLIILPVDGVIHTVRRGETVARIAQIYRVSQEDIARQNKIRNGLIVAGQDLIIPGGKPLTSGNGTVVAAVPLRFGDLLGAKGVQLNLQLPPGEKPPAAIAPTISTAVSNSVLQMPCEDCSITQYFTASHYALDIQTPGGGPIFAAEDGTVIRADYGWNGGYGNVIEIDHGNGLVTLYGHSKELYVKDGDKVKRGQKISWMGNTGLVHGPTGIHVHFEVRVNGVKKNPLLYLE
jgi:murein DD-endopeptidase MepM/ murein hydrolase activator NlpD